MSELTRNQRKYARGHSTLNTEAQQNRRRIARKAERREVAAYIAGPLRQERHAAQIARARFPTTRKTNPKGLRLGVSP